MTHAHDARLTQRFVRDRWFKWLNDTERLTPKAGATNGANLGCLSFDEVVELTLGWEVVFDDFSRLHDVFFYSLQEQGREVRATRSGERETPSWECSISPLSAFLPFSSFFGLMT